VPRPTNENTAVNFEIFPWNSNFNTGIALIDEQHKKLVEILNKLAAHLAMRSSPVTLNEVFVELTDYADYHFKSEEEIWKAHFKNDDWYIQHDKTHESFITKVSRIKLEGEEKTVDAAIYEVISFLSQWLAYHILDGDKRMAMAVLAMEAGESLEQAKIQANTGMSGATQVLINTVLSMYDSLSTRTVDLMREKALRKQAEEALVASEERWKFILEGGGENIWDWDIAESIKSYSNSDPAIFDQVFNRLEPSEETRIHSGDLLRVKSDIQAHLKGETEFYVNKHRVLRKNASWGWVLSRGKVVSRDENGLALRMVGTNSDITERELAALIFKHSNQAMFITDGNNEIININPAFTDITGYSEADVIGRSPHFFSSGKHDEPFYRALWDSIESTGAWTGEILNKRKNGEEYWELLSINTALNSSGEIDHYIALFLDITELKKAEESLHRGKKMEAIGQLTGGISHDFNNILNIILGSLELLDDGLVVEDADHKKLIDDIRKASERAADLVRQLHGFSRQQAAKSVVVDLNSKILGFDGFIGLAVSPNIELQKNLANDLWLTSIDPGDFEDALLNLIINAREAISGSGKLSIGTRNIAVDAAFIAQDTDVIPGDYVEMMLSDDGVGIPQENLDHIFEPFFTSKGEGVKASTNTGLGLSMVYGFVKRSKGFIRCESQLGIGTTFKIYLPRAIGAEDVQPNSDKQIAAQSHGNATVLAVDDEPALLRFVKFVLERNGYTVLTATRGQQALDIIEGESKIDLLFSDISMPGGMNGYQLAEKAVALRPQLKVLLTSGYSTRDLSESGMSDLRQSLLSKPYNSSALLKILQQMLENK